MSETQKPIRFSQLLTQHVNNIVQKTFLHEQLTPAVLRAIRDRIHETISAVFERSTHKLSPMSRMWLTNQYFKRIQINGEQSMNDMIVINDHKLEQLPFEDVHLLKNLFDQTELNAELDAEYRKRTLS